MKKIEVINACCDLGVHVCGANLGPEIITKKMNAKYVKTIKAKDYIKELDKNNKRKNLEGVNEFNSRLYEEVKNKVEDGYIPLTIGGDHSIAIATALASIAKYKNMGIIWFDAHGDYNTFNTTISGNIHGLPLAAITNFEKNELTKFHKGNYYKYKNTVIVGGRDIDPLERKNIEKCGVTLFSTEDIKKYGAKNISKKAFEIASNGTQGVHISFDIDLIDPKIAPGVSIPAVDGINLEEAYEIVDCIISNKDILKSIDVVEFNPLKDKDNITEEITRTICNKLYSNMLKKT